MSGIIHIDQRLAALPPKIAQPFRQLLAAGQLSEDVLHTLLDARELTGDSPRILGFAIGYLHLRGQGIPVHDVIRMAKDQGRRINLAWSPKRWKAEHDRLSRAEALHRLSEDNVAYDVSRFAALLPPRFDGYLIRTSRRLGMESLRQRHCVAGYHDLLQHGNRAIAVVFIDRQRWTVELLATQNPDQPLQIGQVRTRLNGHPSSEVLARIHQTLGIDPALQRSAPFPHCADGRTYMENLRRLLPILRERGVVHVIVTFDGSGDDGSINHIEYSPDIAANPGTVPVTYETVVRRFEDGRWIEAPEHAQGTMNDALESLTYDYLEETDVDWCNNDGGFGELVIDVERGTVTLDVNTRYIADEHAFFARREILTGEEV